MKKILLAIMMGTALIATSTQAQDEQLFANADRSLKEIPNSTVLQYAATESCRELIKILIDKTRGTTREKLTRALDHDLNENNAQKEQMISHIGYSLKSTESQWHNFESLWLFELRSTCKVKGFGAAAIAKSFFWISNDEDLTAHVYETINEGGA